MELRINRDVESHHIRSIATEGKSPDRPEASPQTEVGPRVDSVEVARRQVAAENQAASRHVRDPGMAAQLAKQIRMQISKSSDDAVKAQASRVTPQVLRTLVFGSEEQSGIGA